MKVLVPCDFSKTSNNAALYAAKLCRKVGAEMILFHVVHFEHPPMVQVFSHIEEKIEEVRRLKAFEECSLLLEQLCSQVENFTQISFKIVSGFPIQTMVEEFVKENGIDLVIMGTKGATGLQKVLFGSQAVSVIEKSSVPVMTIPEHKTFNSLKLIVLASDLSNIDLELEKIIPFGKLFQSSIVILNVESSPSQKIKNTDLKALMEKFNEKKISFHSLESEDILEGINAFVFDSKADILAMHTHEMSFFETLFTTNLTREEAFHSFIPLFTFKTGD